jgi:hypothetical protein
MAVMMQAFYWDAPIRENKRGEWWNFLAEKVPQLAASGIDSLWLPPFSKVTNPTSNDYDPYDYFDLGDFDQKGSVKTLYSLASQSIVCAAKFYPIRKTDPIRRLGKRAARGCRPSGPVIAWER